MDRRHHRRFPVAIKHDGREYLTTAQVAKVLGVKESTIYAYVSRGRLQSHRIAGYDGSVFALGDIENAMSSRARPRTPAGATERIRTQLTYLHDDRLYYRGIDAMALAESATYEQVAELLWQKPWPTETDSANSSAERIGAAVGRICGAGARGVDRIRMAVDLSGARDAQRHNGERDAVVTKAAGAILAAISALGPGPSTGSVAHRLWPRLTDVPPTRRHLRLLDGALVALADHDMSASTLAARVAASARGSVYAVIGAGLGAFDGPIHGGATSLAYRFLAAALDDPAAAIADHERGGMVIPGTGHVVYAHHDPRADYLVDALGRLRGGDVRVMVAVAALQDSLGTAGFINSDLALAALALCFEMRVDAAETIFAVARIVGWTAHALEEYAEPRLRFRPEGIYTGVRPTTG